MSGAYLRQTAFLGAINCTHASPFYLPPPSILLALSLFEEITLKSLELKIPPAAVFGAFGLIMWSISSLPPQFSMLEGNRFIVILTLLLGEAYFGLSGVISFKKVGTTVHPMQPEKASALVTSGVYQVSRNPMYLGLLLGLISWGLYLSSLWAVACCVLFVAYMNRFQIAPEERAMEKRFGEDFNMYRQRTRRWL